MLDNIFGKKVTDKHFGDVKVTKDKKSGTFSLDKNINFGHFKKIGLSLDNCTAESTQRQFELYNVIIKNSETLLNAAKDKYFDSYNKDLFEEWELETISLNDRDSDWQLWFEKKGGWEYCLVEFNELDVQEISFQG